MWKRILLLAALFPLLLAGPALAVPTTWTDVLDFNPDIKIPPAYSYFHNIADNGFSSAWMGGNDTVSSYALTVALYDDNQNFKFWGKWLSDGNEAASIQTLGGIYSYNFALVSETFTGGSLLGILDILHDGTFNVRIDNAWAGLFTDNDFYLASSRLDVNGDNGAAPVPEPSTLLLLGAGLAGLAYCRRRKNA